jgi:hypothetical protein
MIMNKCKRFNHRGSAVAAPRTAQRLSGGSRGKTPSRTAALVQVPSRPSLDAMRAFGITSRDPPAPATLAASAIQPVARLQTQSGVDITQRVTELLWQACEGNHLTPEKVRATFPGDTLSSDDLAGVWRTLGQAGVDVFDSDTGAPVQPAAPTEEGKLLPLRTQIASVEECMRRTVQGKERPSEAVSALTRRMEEADREMREVLYSFGFAAHKHIARAEELLTQPSGENFEQMVRDAEIGDRREYLRVLAKVAKEARALDQRTAAAFRKWRQMIGQPGEEGPRHEYQKLDGRLRQLLPNFCYRTKVIQEMTATAQRIANNFRRSQRVLQQARQWSDSVCRMPLADVEHQAIETLEGFVRMPGELYLVKCARLRAAEERFEQARRELILGHLSLVTSLAGRHTNRGFGLPELIRLGIIGLLHAVERFADRREWSFPAYAACWIRQSIRGALASQRAGSEEPIRGAACRTATTRKE